MRTSDHEDDGHDDDRNNHSDSSDYTGDDDVSQVVSGEVVVEAETSASTTCFNSEDQSSRVRLHRDALIPHRHVEPEVGLRDVPEVFDQVDVAFLWRFDLEDAVCVAGHDVVGESGVATTV